MSRPFEICRLYSFLRDRAWAHPGSAAHGTFGLLDLERELEHTGLTFEEMAVSVRSLEEVRLLHEVTEEEEVRLGLEHHEHRLYVEPVDDLTAATILISCC